MARLTSGRVCEPVMMVKVPRAFSTGRTPMERYSRAPYSRGAAAARRILPNSASAAADAPPRRNSSRLLTPADRLDIVPPVFRGAGLLACLLRISTNRNYRSEEHTSELQSL